MSWVPASVGKSRLWSSREELASGRQPAELESAALHRTHCCPEVHEDPGSTVLCLSWRDSLPETWGLLGHLES